MNMEGLLTAQPKTPELSQEEQEMRAVRQFIEKQVEADFNGNPDEQYSPGSLQSHDIGYIDKATAEVERRMANPEIVAEIKAHLADINRPDRRWN